MRKDKPSAQFLNNLHFTQDMLTGNLPVPLALLRNYAQMNLSELELIQLLRIMACFFRAGRLDAALVAEEFAIDEEEAAALLQVYLAKGLLGSEEAGGYSCDPLFTRLYDDWIFAKRQQKKSPAKPVKPAANVQPALGELYRIFERELGRNLSPIENEKVGAWLNRDGMPPLLIEEALRRAVLQGKPYIAYIDKILLNWQKQNLKTLAAVEAADALRQRERRPSKSEAQKRIDVF